KSLARLGDDEQRHLRVLESAELRTLRAIHSRPICADPCLCVMPRDQVALPSEVWHPEAVNDIVRVELDEHPLSNRQMNLVREPHSTLRDRVLILDLPPPLVPGHVDRERWRSVRR